MVFSSSVFLFQFLPLLLFLYYFAKDRYRNLVLLVASLAFYAWGEPKNIFLMLLSVFVNYWIGILLDKFRRLDKLLLTIAVIYNLGILYIFKYLNFSVDTLNRVTGAALTIPQIALPIGISFFTFQIMSYVIDVYRKQVEVQKNILGKIPRGGDPLCNRVFQKGADCGSAFLPGGYGFCRKISFTVGALGWHFGLYITDLF